MTASELVQLFDVPGTLREILPYGNGYINDTFVATFVRGNAKRRIVLQRINRKVFTKPQDVMSNLRLILDHCRRKICVDHVRGVRGQAWKMARIIQTRDGRDFAVDANGDVWRALSYIERARTYQRVESVEQAFECGATLGHYLYLVSDLDMSGIVDTIPGFHRTGSYLRQYDAAPKDRAPIEMMAFVNARRELAVSLEAAQRRGEIALRMTHGDPRVNNIMISERNGKGMAMIDLDTSFAGLIQMDVGDAVRSICNPAGEDCGSLDEVEFREDVFKAFIGGFLREAKSFLTPKDVEWLYPAIRLLPFELGLRFFTDYLNGNVYFKVPNPEQNLLRARGQFRLCEIIESREQHIRAIIASET